MSQGFAPFYDVNRTYEDNYLQGPVRLRLPKCCGLMRPILRDRSRLLLLRLRPIPPVRFRAFRPFRPLKRRNSLVFV